MNLFLLIVCFAVVIWSAINHLKYLSINIEYFRDGGRRSLSLWWWLNSVYTKVLSVSLHGR